MYLFFQKIEKQNVDDVNELKTLSAKFEKAVTSLLTYLKSIFGDQNLSIETVPQPVIFFYIT